MTVPETSPRQTLNYLLQLFQAHGIRPKKNLGQNFLIDLNLLDVVIHAAELGREDLVVEIGTGTGSLTSRMADQAGAVLSVEIDRTFHSLASEILADRENVRLVRADILENKNHLNREVLATLADLRQKMPAPRVKLVANLPYVVATPVISNFLLSEFSFERMVAMVQSEIAEKLVARPGSKDYGALAVLVQSLAEVQTIRRRVPPAVFWPRPRVASAIVVIRPSALKRAHAGDVRRLRNFLRDLYTQRRKNLRGALTGLPSRRWSKTEVDRKLADMCLNGTRRAEDLDTEQHLRLCAEFG